VIVLMAIGQANREQILEKMSSMGNTHRLSIWPEPDPHGLRHELTTANVQLVAEIPNVHAAMPFNNHQIMVRAGNVSWETGVWCVTPAAQDIFDWRIGKGTFFKREDERQLAAVAVLGKAASAKLFGDDANAVGRWILLNNVPFLVIGELAEKGTSSGKTSDDATVAIPFSTASLRLLGIPHPAGIQAQVREIDRVDDTVADIKTSLSAAHRGGSFSVSNNPAYVKAQLENVRQQTLLLALIAAISLVVSGIGVMNIMLMAVKERTKEIGIRMATGARRRDIQRQFLTEAVMVSLVGGAMGVLAGFAIGAALVFREIPVIFSIRATLLAFGSAVLTGLVFGFMPARQAARLDPVIALAGE
jgi:macrolide transport system ATP-binding/permease protein